MKVPSALNRPPNVKAQRMSDPECHGLSLKIASCKQQSPFSVATTTVLFSFWNIVERNCVVYLETPPK